MTTSSPSPALVAAAPSLIAGLQSLQQCLMTILTGDPALLVARIAPAVAIMDGQLTLLLPGLLNAEEAVGAAAATSGITNLIAKLQAIQTAPAPAATAATPAA